MKIGMTLPSMVGEYDRDTTLQWCRGIDAGPFSSLACGERIAFRNQEMRVLLAAAAALTERVRIVPTLYVLPMHRTGNHSRSFATEKCRAHLWALPSVARRTRQRSVDLLGPSLPVEKQRLANLRV